MPNNRLLVHKIRLEKFRRFNGLDCKLGNKITCISGQNSAGKSNILSLIASGSGLQKKSQLGSNFQPEFNEFFNIDKNEEYSTYNIYLEYTNNKNSKKVTKRLSFKNDNITNRGIRIIPRTNKNEGDKLSNKEASKIAKQKFDVSPDGRVKIPTIFLSLSRLYPLGENTKGVKIHSIRKNNKLLQYNIDKKFKEWYMSVIPNSIENEASLSKVQKSTSRRNSFYMDMVNTPILSQSTGQDNLGNIISALIDIYILSLEKDYSGAILCIDEVDVSFHPEAQIKLINLFNKLADELNIQFLFTTHSLTIIKELCKLQKKNNENYRIIYIKNPSYPTIIDTENYQILKADMFENWKYNKPKVNIYLEDELSCELFNELLKAYRHINSIIKKNDFRLVRNCPSNDEFKKLYSKFIKLEDALTIQDYIRTIITHKGCEVLITIAEVDKYFRRTVFCLDGDARYSNAQKKPNIQDYIDNEFSCKAFNQNPRKESKWRNCIFLPNYFSPEAYLYKIFYIIAKQPENYSDYWRGLDDDESTVLYTSDKLLSQLTMCDDISKNDNLKNIIKYDNDLWDFTKETKIIPYYYTDYNTINELLQFIDDLLLAYKNTYPIVISNPIV